MVPASLRTELLFGHRYADRKNVPVHSHDGGEFVLITEGRTSCRVGDVILEGRPGTLWIMPPSAPQYQVNHSFTRTVYVGFTDPVFDTSTRAIDVGLDGFVRRWIEDLIDLYESGRIETGSLMIAALLAEVRDIESGAHARAEMPEAVSQAIAWLEQHMTDQDVTVDLLADHVCLSSSHLTALFRKSMGCSPMKYLQHLRLRQAERLLKDPHLSVKQVAKACGYADCNYFVRLFRKRYGSPPGKWRE